MQEQSYNVIGLMSGTSLDGVDLAYCTFNLRNGNWSYSIEKAETLPYDQSWRDQLNNMMNCSALAFVRQHVALGKLYGTLIKEFILKHQIKPMLISSHGHTVFHQPQNGFTSQIGDGSQIAALTEIDTICDFRSKDLALGGQGAPLVPGGEMMLFNDYRFCLNLGGIANISVIDKKVIAFDICPANMALNYLANKLGAEYDKGGKLAENGLVDSVLLNELNSLEYYRQSYPKSMGKEWFEQEVQPLLDRSSIAIENQLATMCSHIAFQIAGTINQFNPKANDKLLVTGGGAFNFYLVDEIRKKISVQLQIPDAKTIAFKEALIFAFLGLLFYRGEVNVLSSVTGSSKNHIGGALYKGN
jgi:anhydro-N-acetylmuramic acid kinase